MGLVEEGTSWWLVGLLKAWLLKKTLSLVKLLIYADGNE
jgi:hypothetical protein